MTSLAQRPTIQLFIGEFRRRVPRSYMVQVDSVDDDPRRCVRAERVGAKRMTRKDVGPEASPARPGVEAVIPIPTPRGVFVPDT